MKVLAIGAHFDDVELGCGGTLIKHRRHNDDVDILVVTDSSFRDPRGNEIRTQGKPEEEGRRSAAFIGARLIAEHFPTNNVLFDEKLVLAIRTVVENSKYDMVYTHHTEDVHLDHCNVARATLSAARHVASVLMYRSNWYLGEGRFDARHFVDITDVYQDKLDLLSHYRSEFARQGDNWVSFLEHQHALFGRMIGVGMAEGFEVVKYLAPL